MQNTPKKQPLIRRDFTGGNIVADVRGDDVFLCNELRDTPYDWFYWAFCVEGAAGRTLSFRFDGQRIGYFGPAVSRDLSSWRWLADTGGQAYDHERDGETFSYRFGPTEDRVYFAHHALYHPDRFAAFCRERGLTPGELCRSERGRSVPFVTFGRGRRQVILTARHHACESTGDYVLEGVLDELIRAPLPDAQIYCVPFVDLDGVLDGDQGKGRAPHDHAREYDRSAAPLYASTAAIRARADAHGCTYGFDFHSPWHIGTENDNAFIVRNSTAKDPRADAFGALLEEETAAAASFPYRQADDHPVGVTWNQGAPNFSRYMSALPDNEVAFTLETAYFGHPDEPVTPSRIIALGRAFARALRRYVADCEGRIPLLTPAP